jgi:hypothetical protein
VHGVANTSVNLAVVDVGHDWRRVSGVSAANFTALATAIKIANSSAVSNIALNYSTSTNRILVRSLSTVVNLNGSSSGTRTVYSTGQTAIDFSTSNIGFRSGYPSAITFFGVSGRLGASANKIGLIHATTNVAFAQPSVAHRFVFASSISTVQISDTNRLARKAYISASTTIRLKSEEPDFRGRPGFQSQIHALGGNPMASTYIGYLGQFQQGQTINLMLRATAYQGRIIVPDDYPVAKIYKDAALIATVQLPVVDEANSVFSLPLFLGLPFDLGRYIVSYRYSVGGFIGARVDYFEVIPGGDPGGTVISMFSYDRPEAGYVLSQLSCGKLISGRNPRI